MNLQNAISNDSTPNNSSNPWTTGMNLQRPSQERLLAQEVELTATTSQGNEQGDKSQAQVVAECSDETLSNGSQQVEVLEETANVGGRPAECKVYKRRWFGLAQLVLLNIIVSWDWLSFAPVSETAATYFSTTPSIINWLSTGFLFAYVAASPFTLYALHTGGPKLSIVIASVLILVGNWIRYAGTRASPPRFPVVMFGQVLIGLAQPFVLSAPTRYSDLWFSPRGRVSATAIASLANPFGGALGQLINPFLATTASQIPSMTLYVAIISTISSLPSFFIPSSPPTPPSPSPPTSSLPLFESLHLLLHNPNFYLVTTAFSLYVALFNTLSSLLTQILTPYSFSETAAGIAGAVLILVGLVSAAISSPILDHRPHQKLVFIKFTVLIIFLAYLIFIWMPATRSIAAVDVVMAVLGAASFSLMPVALEWLVEDSKPAGVEVGSCVCWAGGQLLGGIFIVVCDKLKDGESARPPFEMGRALVFMAVIAGVGVPCALLLGRWGRREGRRGAEE